ncbi:MAG TPA: hypothetical protein VLG50_07650 [Candidatus Saccharimonadales bacterium]|nr:hypothetical protein [Candidatus Saccharimonadales bacterium]
MDKFDNYIINLSPHDFDYRYISVVKDESRYSSLMPWHISQVKNCITHFTNDISFDGIIDATAHIGCDTILFRLLFPNLPITAIEKNENTFDILKKNMNNLCQIVHHDIRGIDIIHQDCTDYLMNRDLSRKLIYIDPPWNGTDYKLKTCIDLHLSSYHVVDFINCLLCQNSALIIVKLPSNFNFKSFNYIKDVVITYHNIVTQNNKISYILGFIRLKNIIHDNK